MNSRVELTMLIVISHLSKHLKLLMNHMEKEEEVEAITGLPRIQYTVGTLEQTSGLLHNHKYLLDRLMKVEVGKYQAKSLLKLLKASIK